MTKGVFQYEVRYVSRTMHDDLQLAPLRRTP
jgi:hypothetical protein